MPPQEAITFLKNTSPLRITIAGDIGAGKSTFSKRLAETLDIPRIYAGGLFREEAARRGISLEELNVIREQDDQLDKDIDAMQKAKAREMERGIFEGRTSWHFVENPDVNVFLAVNDHVAAQRIWDDEENTNRDKYSSLEEVKEKNKKRKASEIKIYRQYYDIDVYDSENFDIIIDTSNLDREEVFEETLTRIASFLKNNINQ